MVGLSSLSSRLSGSISDKTSSLLLAELDDDGNVNIERTLRFQYFPETLSDSKQINYQRREIPGGSLPLYQWVSSGERLISFQAYFASDVEYETSNSLFDKLQSIKQLHRNVNVSHAVMWLRRYLHPRYGGALNQDRQLARAPQKLFLAIPRSGIGLAGGGGGYSGSNTVYCIMTQCDVSWEQFFPSGVPRIASVQLAFAQISQREGTVAFPSADSFLELLLDTRESYQLKPHLRGPEGRAVQLEELSRGLEV